MGVQYRYHPSYSSYDTYIMLVTIIPNFALFGYFTTDRFHYQLYGHLARCLKTHVGMESSSHVLGCEQKYGELWLMR